MLKEVIDDALARGEKLKRDIGGQILKSATLNELVNNRHFAETLARVIQTKDEIGRTIKRSVQDVLRAMRIPSKQQIDAYERRVDQLERKIDGFGRNLFRKSLQSNHSRSSRHKKSRH